MKPAITVLMPVFNCEQYIEEAIKCILNQTYTDFELLIIDDASTDQSLAKVEKFQDSRIKVESYKKNHGLIKLLNKAMKAINSPYIARMDADDRCDSRRLELQLDFMELNKDVDICGTHYSFFGKRHESIRMPESKEEIAIKLLEGCPVLHGSMMIRRQCIDKISFNEKYVFAEDYGMFCETFPRLQLANINASLYNYRVSFTNTSVIHRKQQLESHKAARKNLLTTLGLSKISDRENTVFHRVAEGQYVLNFEELKLFEKVAMRLLTCNQEKKLLQSKLLNKKLRDWFFWVSFYSSRYGMDIFYFYHNSSLKKRLSVKFRLELWARCKLRIKI